MNEYTDMHIPSKYNNTDIMMQTLKITPNCQNSPDGYLAATTLSPA